MQLIIQIDEAHITNIAESYVRSSLRIAEFGSQNAMVDYIQQQTKAAILENLQGVDWKVMIQAVARLKLEEITNDVVGKVIESHVKKVVKKMKDEGELV
jgi:hypothetical protein